MFNIPLFKSDSFIYRRREKIQNELSVNSMWIDVILGCDWQSHEDKIKDLLPSFLMSNGQNLKSDLVRQTDIPYNYFIAGANTSVDLYTSPLFFISETFLILAHISLVYRDWETDRKSTRLNSSHRSLSRMPSSA